MAVGTVVAYREGLRCLLKSDAVGDGAGSAYVDYIADTIKAALLDNSYTPSADTDDFWADISANECADGDYGALNLSGKTVTELAGGNTMFDHADLDYGSAVTIAARYVVWYNDSATLAGDKALLWYVDLNDGGAANVSSTASDFKVNLPAGGVYQIAP